jgi:hypothetical protein
MPKSAIKPSAKKMDNYRARMRRKGLRPIQIWVPDSRAPGFAEEARRQSLLASAHPSSREADEFIEAAADFGDEY